MHFTFDSNSWRSPRGCANDFGGSFTCRRVTSLVVGVISFHFVKAFFHEKLPLFDHDQTAVRTFVGASLPTNVARITLSFRATLADALYRRRPVYFRPFYSFRAGTSALKIPQPVKNIRAARKSSCPPLYLGGGLGFPSWISSAPLCRNHVPFATFKSFLRRAIRVVFPYLS